MFTLMFELGKAKETIDGNLAWYSPVITAAGFTPENILDRAEKMKTLSENLSAASSLDEFIDEEAPHEAPPMKQAQDQLIITPVWNPRFKR